MGVTLKLHPLFAEAIGGGGRLEVEGRTVEECLEGLLMVHPELRRKLFTEGGELQPHVGIYLNGTAIRPDELARPVSAGDEVTVGLIVVGG